MVRKEKKQTIVKNALSLAILYCNVLDILNFQIIHYYCHIIGILAIFADQLAHYLLTNFMMYFAIRLMTAVKINSNNPIAINEESFNPDASPNHQQ